MTTAVVYTNATSGDYIASYGVSAVMLSETNSVDYYECSPEGDPILTEAQYTDCVAEMASVGSLGLSSTDCSVVVAGGGEVTPTDAPGVPTDTPPVPTDAPDVPTDEPPAPPTDAPSGAFSLVAASSLMSSAAFAAAVVALLF